MIWFIIIRELVFHNDYLKILYEFIYSYIESVDLNIYQTHLLLYKKRQRLFYIDEIFSNTTSYNHCMVKVYLLLGHSIFV